MTIQVVTYASRFKVGDRIVQRVTRATATVAWLSEPPSMMRADFGDGRGPVYVTPRYFDIPARPFLPKGCQQTAFHAELCAGLVDQDPSSTRLLSLAAEAVIDARDYRADTGSYPPPPLGPDLDSQCFDDWAADLLQEALGS